ncbi:hypothetical protein E2C01_037693 [Portunus trituberculatus]|uniref:Uncharacterized protein n=1 Tax=Portunus trituberculatus TaxID=210409 RepID=A0A5B7FHQ2_PORTR|nr:hypothetical protein [Portunus trituberculatus]
MTVYTYLSFGQTGASGNFNRASRGGIKGSGQLRPAIRPPPVSWPGHSGAACGAVMGTDTSRIGIRLPRLDLGECAERGVTGAALPRQGLSLSPPDNGI